MINVKKHAIALTLATVAIAAAVTPSFAATRAQRAQAAAQGDVYGAYAQQPYEQSRYGINGSPVPAAVINAPNQCWSDEGYGRWSSCDGAGG